MSYSTEEAPASRPAARAFNLPGGGRSRFGREALVHLLLEHGLPLLLYTLLSLALSWPAARHFTTHILSDGGDARHNLWVYWHFQQWAQGEEPLFQTNLLYYPEGISLLLHGVGPVMAFLALPFWRWGPEAAYNGVILLSLLLTGYAMYLLARALRMGRAVALFAGLTLLTSAMPMAGILGTPEKVLLAPLPLTILALHHTLDSRRSPWWTVVTALCLLLTLATSGYQFIFAALSIGFFFLARWAASTPPRRRFLLRRALALAGSSLLIVGPLLVAIVQLSRNPQFSVDVVGQAYIGQPDLLRFLVPSPYSRFLGGAAFDAMASFRVSNLGIETSVSLPWTLLALSLVAIRYTRRSRFWFGFFLFCFVLALGPALKLMGETFFTQYEARILLPSALLLKLPGLGFMRFAGRWMKIGSVALGLTASFGLAFLIQRFPRYGALVLASATALLLVETWPNDYPMEQVPRAPAFYQQLAGDTEEYGVLDLPLAFTERPFWDFEHVSLTSFYQMYQMVHGKGIASGYLSRTYNRHPFLDYLFTGYQAINADVRVNGVPANSYANLRADLVEHGYRYVVWHKTLGGQRDLSGTVPWTQQTVDAAIEESLLLTEDDATIVYELGSLSDEQRVTTLGLAPFGWYPPAGEYRWVVSPARLRVDSAQAQEATLQITPTFIHDPQSPSGLGESGLLSVRVGDAAPLTVPIMVNQTANVPLTLPAGPSTIELALQSGNFQPTQYGGSDISTYSFAIRTINLQLAEGGLPEEKHLLTLGASSPPPDILIDGQLQARNAGRLTELVAFHGADWHNPEPTNGRWGGAAPELLIYSAEAQRVQLSLSPTLIHVPGAPYGLGEEGVLRLSVNDGAPQSLKLQRPETAPAEVELRPGWNTIKLSLEAGAFRPSDVDPNNGDVRLLSFALEYIDILTE